MVVPTSLVSSPHDGQPTNQTISDKATLERLLNAGAQIVRTGDGRNYLEYERFRYTLTPELMELLQTDPLFGFIYLSEAETAMSDAENRNGQPDPRILINMIQQELSGRQLEFPFMEGVRESLPHTPGELPETTARRDHPQQLELPFPDRDIEGRPFRSKKITELLKKFQGPPTEELLRAANYSSEGATEMMGRGSEAHRTTKARGLKRAASRTSHFVTSEAQTCILISILSVFHHAKYIIHRARLENETISSADFLHIAEQSFEHVFTSGAIMSSILGGTLGGRTGEFLFGKYIQKLVGHNMSRNIFKKLIVSGAHSLFVFTGWEIGGELWEEAVRMIPEEQGRAFKQAENFWDVVFGVEELEKSDPRISSNPTVFRIKGKYYLLFTDYAAFQAIFSNMWKILVTDSELRSNLFYNAWRHRIARGDFITLIICMTGAGVVGQALLPFPYVGFAFGLVGGFAHMFIPERFHEEMDVLIKDNRVAWNDMWKGANSKALSRIIENSSWAETNLVEWRASVDEARRTWVLGGITSLPVEICEWGAECRNYFYGSEGINEWIQERRKLRENIINPLFELFEMAHGQLETLFFERELIDKLKAQEDAGFSRENSEEFQIVKKEESMVGAAMHYVKDSFLDLYFRGATVQRMVEINDLMQSRYEDMLDNLERTISSFYEEEVAYFKKLIEEHNKSPDRDTYSPEIGRALHVELQRLQTFYRVDKPEDGFQGFFMDFFEGYHTQHKLPCTYYDSVKGVSYSKETRAFLKTHPIHPTAQMLLREGKNIDTISSEELAIFIGPCVYHSMVDWISLLHFEPFREDYVLFTIFDEEPARLAEEWGVDWKFLLKYYARTEDRIIYWEKYLEELKTYSAASNYRTYRVNHGVPRNKKEFLVMRLNDPQVPIENAQKLLRDFHDVYEEERGSKQELFEQLHKEYEWDRRMAVGRESQNRIIFDEEGNAPFVRVPLDELNVQPFPTTEGRYSLFYDSQRRALYPIANDSNELSPVVVGTWRHDPYALWERDPLRQLLNFPQIPGGVNLYPPSWDKRLTPFEVEMNYMAEKQRRFGQLVNEGSYSGVYRFLRDRNISITQYLDRLAPDYRGFLESALLRGQKNIFASYYEELKTIMKIKDKLLADREKLMERELTRFHDNLVEKYENAGFPLSEEKVTQEMEDKVESLMPDYEGIERAFNDRMSWILDEWKEKEVAVFAEMNSTPLTAEEMYYVFYLLEKVVELR